MESFLHIGMFNVCKHLEKWGIASETPDGIQKIVSTDHWINKDISRPLIKTNRLLITPDVWWKAKKLYVLEFEVKLRKEVFLFIIHRVRKKSLRYFRHNFNKYWPIFDILGLLSSPFLVAHWLPGNIHLRDYLLCVEWDVGSRQKEPWPINVHVIIFEVT